MRPIDDRIIVRPIKEDLTTASGFQVKNSAPDKPLRGQVIAVGTGTAVKVGETVIYGKSCAVEVEDENGDMVHIMRQSDPYSILD